MRTRRGGFSLVELLVVFAIISILMGLAIPAVQATRERMARLQCMNNLRNIGLAIHQYHDTSRYLPPSLESNKPQPFRNLSWRIKILPYLELGGLFQTIQSESAAKIGRKGSELDSLRVSTALFECPSDPRLGQLQSAYTHRPPFDVALSSYLGNAGMSYLEPNGVIFGNSRVRLEHISDGTSSTILVGERPPSNNYEYGWTFWGSGQDGDGSLDHCMGARELARENVGCPPGPYNYVEARLGVPCAFMHYWSLHAGGAHFLMCDGSVQFLSYTADPILPALATRAGGEVVQLP